MKNDIDFIKWMCDKAEGFEWSEDQTISIPSGDWFFQNQGVMDKVEWKHVYYPLLLQRAIEGVNKEGVYNICLMSDCISVEWPLMTTWENATNFCYDEYGSIDVAKDSALRYVYEQEKGYA